MKHPLASFLILAGAALLPGSLTTTARAATILHNFIGGSSDGSSPNGSLTLSGSKLYGMTYQGGSGNYGTAFSMNTDGTGFTVLHSFTPSSSGGYSPYGSLTLSGSKLYGMTTAGGFRNDGTVFSMNIDGSGYTQLHTFIGGSTDGDGPYGSLTLSGSKLYGMTYSGGSSTGLGYGTAFSMNLNGSGFTLLHSFTGDSDGGYPLGSLTLSGSKLYGMTEDAGGTNKLFSMNTDGTGFTVLHLFLGGSADGRIPFGSLTLSGSKLYGMTKRGGSNNFGTAFSIDLDGTSFTLLHAFTGGSSDGANPLGSLTLFGSTFYGMTQSGGSSNLGTLFSINTDGTGFTVLQSFAGQPGDGAGPSGDVTLSSDGSMLYGMTPQGGTANVGVVFSRSLVPEPGTFALLGFGALLLGIRCRSARV